MSGQNGDSRAQPVVLVVEDDRDTRDFFVDMLTYEGYLVLAVMKGREGLELLAERRVDGVVLDLRLPDIDGYRVCREIRAGDQRDVPILVVSANRASDSRERALAAGATEYLEKPFDLHALTALVRSLTGGAS